MSNWVTCHWEGRGDKRQSYPVMVGLAPCNRMWPFYVVQGQAVHCMVLALFHMGVRRSVCVQGWVTLVSDRKSSVMWLTKLHVTGSKYSVAMS